METALIVVLIVAAIATAIASYFFLFRKTAPVGAPVKAAADVNANTDVGGGGSVDAGAAEEEEEESYDPVDLGEK